jgi:L-threonylcarbamoyladenylate synthase
MTEIFKQQEMTSGDWERVSASLYQGGLVTLPSDTVYGLACLATVPEAVERIYEVKGRRREKPVALVFTSVDHVLALIPDLPEAISDAITGLLPGPVTAIVPFEEGTGGIEVHGGGSVGVRIIPAPAGDIYVHLPGPLAVTSANFSGQPDPGRVDDIPPGVVEACDLVVDAGACEHRIPSTVVDLRPLAAGKAPIILRKGVMLPEEIEERLGR